MNTRGRHLLALLCLAAGCTPNNSGSTLQVCQALSAMPAPTTPLIEGTVFTIVMENHSRGEILGNASAPFINSLAKQYAVAYGYHDSYVHPSEANYLWMSAGENFDILDDDDPDSHHLDSESHIADQLEAAGLTWRAYQEAMGEPCGLKSHGRYAAKHNPFVYFDDITGWDGTSYQPGLRCNDHVVDYTALATDIANNKVPRYAFITPDLDNDMHDGSISDGDKWLSQEIPKIMASDAYKHGGVIFLLWDEGGGYPSADDPAMIVISEHAVKGMASQTDYDTSAYLRTVETLLGVAPLPCDDARETIDPMADLFAMPLDPVAAVARTMPSTATTLTSN